MKNIENIEFIRLTSVSKQPTSSDVLVGVECLINQKLKTLLYFQYTYINGTYIYKMDREWSNHSNDTFQIMHSFVDSLMPKIRLKLLFS